MSAHAPRRRWKEFSLSWKIGVFAALFAGIGVATALVRTLLACLVLGRMQCICCFAVVLACACYLPLLDHAMTFGTSLVGVKRKTSYPLSKCDGASPPPLTQPSVRPSPSPIVRRDDLLSRSPRSPTPANLSTSKPPAVSASSSLLFRSPGPSSPPSRTKLVRTPLPILQDADRFSVSSASDEHATLTAALARVPKSSEGRRDRQYRSEGAGPSLSPDDSSPVVQSPTSDGEGKREKSPKRLSWLQSPLLGGKARLRKSSEEERKESKGESPPFSPFPLPAPHSSHEGFSNLGLHVHPDVGSSRAAAWRPDGPSSFRPFSHPDVSSPSSALEATTADAGGTLFPLLPKRMLSLSRRKSPCSPHNEASTCTLPSMAALDDDALSSGSASPSTSPLLHPTGLPSSTPGEWTATYFTNPCANRALFPTKAAAAALRSPRRSRRPASADLSTLLRSSSSRSSSPPAPSSSHARAQAAASSGSRAAQDRHAVWERAREEWDRERTAAAAAAAEMMADAQDRGRAYTRSRRFSDVAPVSWMATPVGEREGESAHQNQSRRRERRRRTEFAGGTQLMPVPSLGDLERIVAAEEDASGGGDVRSEVGGRAHPPLSPGRVLRRDGGSGAGLLDGGSPSPDEVVSDGMMDVQRRAAVALSNLRSKTRRHSTELFAAFKKAAWRPDGGAPS